MLNITKGQSNELIVTLSNEGRLTIDNPTYLFYFVSPNGKKSAFILANESDHTSRYDQFTFVEGSSQAKTLEAGSYDYFIYAQESTTNLNPELADELIEEGLAMVSRSSTEPVSHEIAQTIKSHVVNG